MAMRLRSKINKDRREDSFDRAVKKLAPSQQLPEETETRIKAALERLQDKEVVVLALIPSSKEGKPPYPIMLGRNNTIWCKCNGFKYRSECRHMDRFRLEIKPVVFK